ncbi:MAG: DUF2891 domain-containing protein [Saprospiraceae bacterium]|nr:DUF2891 domain-containing protein [Saprospiraceae bacterium]
MNRYITSAIIILSILSCSNTENPKNNGYSNDEPSKTAKVILDLDQANRLAQLPIECIQNPLPYKSGLVIAQASDLKMPREHHPAFYGCFDWHSAVHGHWSLVYLMKTFPNLAVAQEARKKLNENLTAENILKEIEYFSLNKNTKSFERTYGWAWLLKLQEELYTWDDVDAKRWYQNIKPLAEHISNAYIEYLPKLVYPIRVGEHSNTAFGLSFAFDYAKTVDDENLKNIIVESALRFYNTDKDCPISWEPSGYDFLSPCLQELDIMRKVLSSDQFSKWSIDFLPGLFNQNLKLDPAEIRDRSDGKLVHLDGLNFSRAWCLYTIDDSAIATDIANQHLKFSLDNITDGDYAGQHWLASFALYAFKSQSE